MDIERFIPDSDRNWSVKNNTIYYKKYGQIPVLKKIDDEYYISLDQRITNKVIKVITHLTNLEQVFYLCDRNTISEKHIHNEDIELILKNYLFALTNPVFFRYIQISNFDFIRNLTNFLNLYDCHAYFKNIYDHLKVSHFDKVWMDWYTRTEHHAVKNEEIRDYYSILLRQIKLNMFFD